MAALPKHDPTRIKQDPAAPARNMMAWAWTKGIAGLDHEGWDFVDHRVTPQRVPGPDQRFGNRLVVIRRAGRAKHQCWLCKREGL
jgi:hypothetical protein